MDVRTLLSVCVAIVACVLAIQFRDVHPEIHDAEADWIVTHTAWLGGNPYRPLGELAADAGVANGGQRAPHLRPPAALLLQAPYLLIERAEAVAWMGYVSIPALIALLYWTARIANLEPWKTLAFAPIVLVKGNPFDWGTHSLIVAALIVGAWAIRRPWAGALLGMAAVVKLWPALIVVALLRERDRRAVWAIGAGGALTVVGLVVVPGASVSDFIDGTAAASRGYLTAAGNGSLPAFMVRAGANYVLAPALVGVAAGLWWWLRSPRAPFATSVAAALIATPLVWNPYYWAAAPILAIHRRSPLAWSAFGLWLIFADELAYLGAGLLIVATVQVSTSAAGSRYDPATL